VIRPGLLLGVADLDALTDPGVVVIDTRIPVPGSVGRERYDAGHVPGAAYVDQDADLADPPGAGGRHPLPSLERFTAAMRRAGVRRGSSVVVYDEGPATAASRLWWLLRDHGHDDVMVLDGGLAAWRAAGHEPSTGPVESEPGDWSGTPGHLPVLTTEEVSAFTHQGVLIDVRAAERFRGETEPLDPVAGHIPGAVNAPLAGNTDELGRFLDDEVLRSRFAGLGAEGREVATYCGSGVTATQTILALRLAGLDAALYPGSWSGWIADGSRPVATGP
jgi:thiosulfate/3-mercaptopyruvate sulfurtransferase